MAPYKDKEKQLAFQKKWMKDRRDRLVIALGGKCERCGSTDFLEFDHVDHKQKTFQIASTISTPKKLLPELKKCQILCRPCHKIKTYSDMGWPSFDQAHGTGAGYKRYKCRCEKCREWSRNNRRVWRAKAR